MTLNDAIAGALPELRAAAESLMALTLTAYAPDGKALDEDDMEVPAYLDKGTTPGKVQGPSSQGGDTATRYVRIGESGRPVLSGGLHIPLGAFVDDLGLHIVASEQIGHAWEFQVTAVAGLADAALLGARYLVVGVPTKSFATARRLDVVELPPQEA